MLGNDDLNRQWERRIADYRASGLTAAAWCAREGITVSQLKYWIQKARKAAKEVGAPKWTRVEVAPESPAASKITINVGAARIEVESGFDSLLLSEVLRVALVLSKTEGTASC